jgi:hypothetical protein
MADIPVPVPATRMHHIYEDDLAVLERTLPQLASALMPMLNNRLRVQLRQVQRILMDVRWDYGPAENVKSIPAGESQDSVDL